MNRDDDRLSLGDDLATALGVPTSTTRGVAARRLAEVAGLRKPRSEAARLVLSEIVGAVETQFLTQPAATVDRAEFGHVSLSLGCRAAGEEAVLAAREELGAESLDDNVRGALCHMIAPALYERGAINLIGG